MMGTAHKRAGAESKDCQRMIFSFGHEKTTLKGGLLWSMMYDNDDDILPV